MTDPTEPPLYSWRGHLAEVEIWEGPAEIYTASGEYVEVNEGETVAEVMLLELSGRHHSWVVPLEDLEEHAEPVNLAALEEVGAR